MYNVHEYLKEYYDVIYESHANDSVILLIVISFIPTIVEYHLRFSLSVLTDFNAGSSFIVHVHRLLFCVHSTYFSIFHLNYYSNMTIFLTITVESSFPFQIRKPLI
jgi:hypothetical protein